MLIREDWIVQSDFIAAWAWRISLVHIKSV